MKKFISLLMVMVMAVCISSTAFAMDSESEVIQFDLELLKNVEVVGIDADGSVELHIIKPQGLNRSGFQVTDDTRAKIIPLTVEVKQDLEAAVLGGNANYKEIADRSGAITMYSTTRWETKVTNNREYKRVTGFSGGIDAPGTGIGVSSGVVIDSSKIVYGAVGIGEGKYVSGGTTINISAGTRYYNYSRTTEWIYSLDPDGSAGHTFTVVLKRGTGKWSTQLINQI